MSSLHFGCLMYTNHENCKQHYQIKLYLGLFCFSYLTLFNLHYYLDQTMTICVVNGTNK